MDKLLIIYFFEVMIIVLKICEFDVEKLFFKVFFYILIYIFLGIM